MSLNESTIANLIESIQAIVTEEVINTAPAAMAAATTAEMEAIAYKAAFAQIETYKDTHLSDEDFEKRIEERVHHALTNDIDFDDIASRTLEYIDLDDIANNAVNQIDIDDVSSSVISGLNYNDLYYNLEDKVKRTIEDAMPAKFDVAQLEDKVEALETALSRIHDTLGALLSGDL